MNQSDQREQIKENCVYDLVIVGGGAAGLMAAFTAAQQGKSVVLLEKMEKTGRKVRITGKGRCNLTNTCGEEEFLSKVCVNSDFFAPSFRFFNNSQTVRFFERAGVKTVTEQGGRVYPKSGKAWDVAQALVDKCREEGVKILCDARVDKVVAVAGRVIGVDYHNKRGFLRRMEATNVLLATGGASYPATGSTGDGYRLAHDLGHTIVEIRPSLVPLVSDYGEMEYMNGLLLRNVRARLIIDGEQVQEEFGEMSFSQRGVEGAVALRMSRKAVDALIDNRKVDIMVDLKSGMDEAELENRIKREIAQQPADILVGELLRKMMPKELIIPIAKKIALHSKRTAMLSQEKINELVRALKNFRLHISDYGPFEQAVVTAGGVSADEIEPTTLESKKIRGLYFAGELIDLDANTGGYNLQIAFSTGRLAAQLKSVGHEQ